MALATLVSKINWLLFICPTRKNCVDRGSLQNLSLL